MGGGKTVKRKSENGSKKPSCPYGRRCFTDSSVCGHIGEYAECPLTLDEKIRAEVREGTYRGNYYPRLRRARLVGE